MFEDGHIAYGSTEDLVEYCYEEVESCDILVALIGRRFGSASSDDRYSVSHRELLCAHQQGKQIYVFVERNVISEYQTYQENRENREFRLHHADDHRVYKFLDEFLKLRRNNACFDFETSQDIIEILSLQLSNLLGRLVREKLLPSTQTPSVTTTEHPAWKHLGHLLQLPYSVTFRTELELTIQLQHHGYQSDRIPWESYKEWSRCLDGVQIVLRASPDLFSGPFSTLVDQAHWTEAMLLMKQFEIETKKKT